MYIPNSNSFNLEYPSPVESFYLRSAVTRQLYEFTSELDYQTSDTYVTFTA